MRPRQALIGSGPCFPRPPERLQHVTKRLEKKVVASHALGLWVDAPPFEFSRSQPSVYTALKAGYWSGLPLKGETYITPSQHLRTGRYVTLGMLTALIGTFMQEIMTDPPEGCAGQATPLAVSDRFSFDKVGLYDMPRRI